MSSLRLYDALSRLDRPRSYVGKFLLIAFIGVHVPLICVVVYVITSSSWSSAIPIVVVTLLATLVGTGLTLLVQSRLLAPVLETSAALRRYVERRELPELPTGYQDEAGALMRHGQECVTSLAELLEMKNRILATLSHDARSPLTSIRFATRMSLEALDAPTVDREELRELLRITEVSADRQLELFNSMLALARAESGTLQVETGRVELVELIDRVVALARLPGEAKGVEVRVEGADVPLPTLALDASKTEQVLSNLVNNAVKFTPRGGLVTVTVLFDGETAGFRVADTGIGIPDSLVGALFSPFTRAQRQGTASESGTGLGLWICRTFVEIQDGEIGVETKEGRGTAFTVRFPAVPAAEQVASSAGGGVAAG